MHTIRQKIMYLLAEKQMNARELSQILGVQEKEVYKHLPHVEYSVTGQGKKLLVQPFQCLSCGYVFENRKRFTPPGRCPRCKRTYLEKPTYRIC